MKLIHYSVLLIILFLSNCSTYAQSKKINGKWYFITSSEKVVDIVFEGKFKDEPNPKLYTLGATLILNNRDTIGNIVTIDKEKNFQITITDYRFYSILNKSTETIGVKLIIPVYQSDEQTIIEGQYERGGIGNIISASSLKHIENSKYLRIDDVKKVVVDGMKLEYTIEDEIIKYENLEDSIDFPMVIFDFPQIESLQFVGVQFSFPNQFHKLKHLKSLYIEFFPWRKFPLPILKIPNLEHLELRGLRDEIPEQISNLNKLKSLDIITSKVTIPYSIGKLTQLERLKIYESQFLAIPKSIKELQELKHLTLKGNYSKNNNRLPLTPPEIWLCKKLEVIYLNIDKRTIPVNNTNIELNNLRQVQISCVGWSYESDENKITNYPSFLIGLPNIEYVWLRFTFIENLPDEFFSKQNGLYEIEAKISEDKIKEYEDRFDKCCKTENNNLNLIRW